MEYKYKASLDTLAKILTAFTFILLLFVGYKLINILMVSQMDSKTILIHVGELALLLTAIVIAYALAPKSYIVDDTDLIIVRAASNKKIKLTDIAEIKIIPDNEAMGGIRTFGVGGLFGYFGKYNYSGIGNVTLYTTQRKNRILIETKQGKKIMITPDDISITEQIKENLKRK